MVRKKVKYKRQSKKNGKPIMDPKLKRFLSYMKTFLVIAGILVLIVYFKPVFLEGIFERGQDANVNEGANSQAKSEDTKPITNTQSKPSAPSSTSPKPPAPVRVPLDIPDYSAYYANLPNILSQNPMVQDIPKGETILLRFYNFNTGVREFEKSYLLTKGNVKEGYLDAPEITIVIHSKYLPEINSNNLCDLISKADSNNDVGIYTDLSTTKLIMKFKGMMEYKGCLM